MAKCKVTKGQTKVKSGVLSPPLTEPEFEKFLCTVTRPIKKPSQPEQEKTQT